jgi:hypothetical protein
MPVCVKCQNDKAADEFYVYKKTGKRWSKCKKCHVDECVARAAANPAAHNARSKAWRDANPERWAATTKAWREANPEKIERNARWSCYRVDFEALWAAQKGLCALCDKPMLRNGRERASACVDHDRSCCPDRRSCGKCVRGLIHWACNLVLGYAKDDPEVLRAAALYLEARRAR